MNYYLRIEDLTNEPPERDSRCDLKALFARHGFDKIEIKAQHDFDGEKERGVEYVNLNSEDTSYAHIQEAIKKLDGVVLHGQTLKVEYDVRYTDDGHAQLRRPPKGNTGIPKKPSKTA